MSFFKKIVNIAGRSIGDSFPSFIIAEIGVNHFGNISLAKQLIDNAISARVDAVKFQIYKTENLVSSSTKDWIDRLKPKELPYQAFYELKNYCDERGIMFLATAHDSESFDYLKKLDIPAYKIGSGEISNLNFIRTIASEGKPVILSTGMYSISDVEKTLEIFKEVGNRELILLHCVTCYPTMPEEANLLAMNTLKHEFECPVGYSDHTLGYDIPLGAAALGANCIEKHFTICTTTLGSQDSLVSVEPNDLVKMVASIRRIEASLGTGVKEPILREEMSKKWARKSVVTLKKIYSGDTIQKDMLTTKRPGTGISPDEIDKIIGRLVKYDLEQDHLLSWEDLN